MASTSPETDGGHHNTGRILADAGKTEQNVVIRYFSTITPKDEGSLILWTSPPKAFNGLEVLAFCTGKGLPLEEHFPQVYDEVLKGYVNLDTDAHFKLPSDGSTLQMDMRLTPLHTTAEEAKENTKPRTGAVLANPGPMALYAFGFTTLMLVLIDAEATENSTKFLVYGYAMFHGGLVQFVVGFFEIARNNLFGATAFTSYGAFWMGWGLFQILTAADVFPAYPVGAAPKWDDGHCAYLVMWGIFTTAMFVQTLYINRCVQAIFFLLAVVFYLLAWGTYNDGAKQAAGIIGVILAVVVFYTATAELYNDMGNIYLPLFQVKTHKREYGNAHPGRAPALLGVTDKTVKLRVRNNAVPRHTSSANNLTQIEKEQMVHRMMERLDAATVSV
mmetsp:Transcript_22129/g.48571  ORF Transcript_22129/g.48571 Transcript_22129/m.48571 type:complete len:388 (-) Transcript_22129:278-1441(-)|eukprot:CAMPEP_0118934890 /NCGR_PEP_ID=MMETSP1169-20130426/14423_1 /TAXON_ID=36882 /ORGANISM="Pyramimonas obovata, Strain CCMP722" /LENGTH=387 /DNA_ID=CAMNT_0006877849 /DNA_START=124 /DNA_END=1287 /DNA_ORIENTATION=+